MIERTNECCGCAVPGYPCIGSACELRNYPHYYCDRCDEEVDQGELYRYDGEELCIDCIKASLEVVL